MRLWPGSSAAWVGGGSARYLPLGENHRCRVLVIRVRFGRCGGCSASATDVLPSPTITIYVREDSSSLRAVLSSSATIPCLLATSARNCRRGGGGTCRCCVLLCRHPWDLAPSRCSDNLGCCNLELCFIHYITNLFRVIVDHSICVVINYGSEDLILMQRPAWNCLMGRDGAGRVFWYSRSK